MSGGEVAPGFGPVADAFAAAVDPTGPGAALAAVLDGQPVVDLWAGTRDAAGTPWQPDTAAVVFSGTKGVVATAVLLLLERGQLDLDWPVARVWPEFAAAGKESVRVADVLAHTAGLPGLTVRVAAGDLLRPERLAQLLAAQEPITPVGAPTYHALTFGWLVDALVRRADGRPVGQLMAEEIAGPLGLDLWLGVPATVHPRVARLVSAPGYQLSALADNPAPDPRLDLVYGNPALADLDWTAPEVLAAGVPAAGAASTARGMARLYGVLATGGGTLLRPDTVAAGVAERSRGPDVLSGRPLRFGAGYELAGTPSNLGPAPDAFGHTGAGGSSHGAWPSLGLGFSLVVSELRTESADDRARSVLAALHAAAAR